MKFSTALFTNLLAASAVLAAPRDSKRTGGHGLASRIARREAARSGNVLQLTESSQALRNEALATGNATQTTLESTNWAGALITAPPAGQTFTSVTGQFTVPTPKKPAGSSGSSAASAWVGIDGGTAAAENAILQTGIDFNVASSGAVSFDAWFEWFPNFATDFTGIPISAGNVIKLTVTSSSSSAGTAVIENVSTGVTVSKALTAPSTSAHLVGQNAEWIVEDFEEGNSLVPFADFGTVTFTGASAETQSESVGVSGADPVILVTSESQPITTVDIVSASEITVTWTGTD